MMTDKAHSLNRHLILAALKSGTGGFEKVNTMIDGMNEVLEGEQVADDKQDVWCLAELDKAKDEAKATEGDIGDLSAAIDSERDSIETSASEIAALKKGLSGGPMIVASQLKMSSPTGPAEQLAGGSRIISCSSLLMRMVEARAAPWCLRINAGALQAFAKPWLKVLVLLMLVRAFMASLK